MKNVVLYSIKGSEEKQSAKTSSKNEAIRALAGALAAGGRASHHPIGKHTFVSDNGILFIGCETNNKGKLTRPVRKVLKDVAADGAKLVVFFSIAKSGAAFIIDEGKAILDAVKIPVHETEYRCTRESTSKKIKFPNEEELKNAKSFAEAVASAFRSGE